MNTEAMHILINFIKEYLGEDLAEIGSINTYKDKRTDEITVGYRTIDQPEGTYHTLQINFKAK